MPNHFKSKSSLILLVKLRLFEEKCRGGKTELGILERPLHSTYIIPGVQRLRRGKQSFDVLKHQLTYARRRYR